MKTLMKIIKIVAWSKIIYGGSQLLSGQAEWSLLILWGVLILSSSNALFNPNKKTSDGFLVVSIISLVAGVFIGEVFGVNLFIFGLIDLICLLKLKSYFKKKKYELVR
jgi:hypothetical protein